MPIVLAQVIPMVRLLWAPYKLCRGWSWNPNALPTWGPRWFLNSDRELYMQPPKQAQTDKLWLLKKCWCRAELVRESPGRTEAVGRQLFAPDPSVIVWHYDQDIIGIMVIPVDDFIYGGRDAFHEKIVGKLCEIFEIASKESYFMNYIGVLLYQSIKKHT